MGELSFIELMAEAERLCAAEDVEAPELMAFDANARVLGPQLTQDDLGALIEAFARVQARIAQERARVRDQLAHAGSGRRALKGYGSLRSAKMCQRASTRA